MKRGSGGTVDRDTSAGSQSLFGLFRFVVVVVVVGMQVPTGGDDGDDDGGVQRRRQTTVVRWHKCRGVRSFGKPGSSLDVLFCFVVVVVVVVVVVAVGVRGSNRGGHGDVDNDDNYNATHKQPFLFPRVVMGPAWGLAVNTQSN